MLPTAIAAEVSDCAAEASIVPEDDNVDPAAFSVEPALLSVLPAALSVELPPTPAAPAAPCCGAKIEPRAVFGLVLVDISGFMPKIHAIVLPIGPLASVSCIIQLARMSIISFFARSYMY